MASESVDGSLVRLHDLLLELVKVAGSPHNGNEDPSPTLSQALVVHELGITEVMTQGELAARLNLDKSTVSRLVAGMEQRGVLIRERDPRNRRFQLVRLTGQGHAMHSRMVAASRDRYEHLARELTSTEREALLLGLPALLRVLRKTRSALESRTQMVESPGRQEGVAATDKP